MQLLNEFERLSGERVDKLMLAGVAKYRDAIMNISPPSDMKTKVATLVAGLKDQKLRSGEYYLTPVAM